MLNSSHDAKMAHLSAFAGHCSVSTASQHTIAPRSASQLYVATCDLMWRWSRKPSLGP